jgi:hypothetical protein
MREGPLEEGYGIIETQVRIEAVPEGGCFDKVRVKRRSENGDRQQKNAGCAQ